MPRLALINILRFGNLISYPNENKIRTRQTKTSLDQNVFDMSTMSLGLINKTASSIFHFIFGPYVCLFAIRCRFRWCKVRQKPILGLRSHICTSCDGLINCNLIVLVLTAPSRRIMTNDNQHIVVATVDTFLRYVAVAQFRLFLAFRI